MSIKVGAKVSGKVTGITNFGAFVQLSDEETGLVHISEVSNNFVKDIHDVLKVGDTVTVKVLKVGDDGKIALSMKQAQNSNQQESNKHSNNSHGHSNHHGGHSHGGHFNSKGKKNFHGSSHKKDNFDDLMSNFLKQSESRLATLRKNTEGKRGGRGGRRN